MAVWLYKTIEARGDDYDVSTEGVPVYSALEKVAQKLDSMGKDGWELVTVLGGEKKAWAFLKKPKE